MLVGLSLALLAAPATAAGSRALDRQILPDPIGGVAYPKSQLATFVGQLVSIEKKVFGSRAKSLLNAAEAWHTTASSNDFVFITLIGFDGSGLDHSSVNTQAANLANEASHSFCANAAGTTPFVNRPTPAVPHSHYVICSEVNGTNIEAITTWRHGILELVTTHVQTIASGQLESIAVHQYDAITGLPAATASSTWTTRKTLGVGAAALAVLIALVVLVMVRRNHRLAVAVVRPPHPGWYPDPRHPKRQRYWTGADWGPSDRR